MLQLSHAPPAQTVFVVPTEFMTFLGVDDSSNFVFRISVGVDLFRAMSLGVSTFNIEAYPISRSGILAGNNFKETTKNFSRRMQTRTQRIQKARTTYRKTQIAKTILDITAFANNEIGSRPVDNSGNIVLPDITGRPQVQQSLRPTKRFIRVLEPGDEVTGHQYAPIGLPSSIRAMALEMSQYKRIATNIINVLGRDPAQVLDFDFPIIDAKRSMGGSIKASNQEVYRRFGQSLRQNLRSPSQKDDNHIQTSVLSLRGSDRENGEIALRQALVMNSTTTPTNKRVLETVQPKYSTVSAILKIPIKQRQKTPVIYINFRCYSRTGTPLQSEEKNFNLGSLVGAKEVPDAPPIMSARFLKAGINEIRIQQQDPYAQKIVVYRRIIENLPELQTDSVFELIHEVAIGRGSGIISLEDRIENGKRIMYRAFAVGRNKEYSQKFASALTFFPPEVAGAHSAISNNRLQSSTVKRALFSSKVMSDRIIIDATVNGGDMSDFVACTLEARDITGVQGGDAFNLNLVQSRMIGATRNENEGPALGIRPVNFVTGAPMSFSDEAVQHDRVYHYSVVAIKYDGSRVTLTGSLIKLFRGSTKGLKIKMSDMRRWNSGISWDMGVISDKVGLETIVSQLKRLGATQSFLDDISNSRDQFSSLFRFLVIRTDLLTGEDERLGVFESGVFTDSNKTSFSRGTSPILAGRKYMYEITLLERDQLTLLADITEGDKDATTLKVFTRNLRKFRNPITLRHSILPASEKLEKAMDNPTFSIDDEFMVGDTGVVTRILYPVPDVSPTLAGFRARTLLDGSNLLTWTIRGNSSKIDHFIIFSEIDGVKAPIGTTVNLRFGKVFSFTDRKTAGMVGLKTYTIIPIYGDFSPGSESVPTTIIKKSELSSFEVAK